MATLKQRLPGLLFPHALTDTERKQVIAVATAIVGQTFLDSSALYARFRPDEPWDSPTNRPLVDAMPRWFRCPSDPSLGRGMTRYEVVVGPNTMFPSGPGDESVVHVKDVTDGRRDTILVGEASRPIHWSAPDDLSFDPAAPLSGFGSRHPGGFEVVFANGSVLFLSTEIDPATLRALQTRNGGERFSPESFHDRPHWRSE
jgi:hypothetical protein